jgi:hypothetical protein
MYPAEPSVSLRDDEDHALANTVQYLLTLSLLGLAVSLFVIEGGNYTDVERIAAIFISG